jgi:hypothetical protein
MLDQNMVVPATVVFLAFIVVGMVIQKASGHKRAQRQKEAWMRNGTLPEHGYIDDSPSFGATLASIFLWAIGGYIAIALVLFQSNPLWVFSLLIH